MQPQLAVKIARNAHRQMHQNIQYFIIARHWISATTWIISIIQNAPITALQHNLYIIKKHVALKYFIKQVRMQTQLEYCYYHGFYSGI